MKVIHFLGIKWKRDPPNPPLLRQILFHKDINCCWFVQVQKEICVQNSQVNILLFSEQNSSLQDVFFMIGKLIPLDILLLLVLFCFMKSQNKVTGQDRDKMVEMSWLKVKGTINNSKRPLTVTVQPPSLRTLNLDILKQSSCF